jgi:signal transduction histidine kinase
LFANLFQNSVKYGGRSDLRIAVRAEHDGNGLVTVSVADNGPGIAFEHRERVFGVFERVDNAEEGTGIGLAVCKRIVETAGGRIWIEDSTVGTDVRLSVPIAGSINGHGGTD